MTKLGDKLKAQIEARDEKYNKAALVKLNADRMAFEADQMKARSITEQVKVSIVCAVDFDQEYKPVVIKSGVFSIYKWRNRIGHPVDFSADPHANILIELVEWGAANGLKIRFVHDHDGVGISEWYKVTVEPK